MNLDGVVIRASYLPMYVDCARRSAARMFGAIVRDAGYELRTLVPGIGAATGTATHKIVSTALEAKRLTGILGNEKESEEAGLESLREEIKEGVVWDDTTPTLNVADQQVVRQARAYRRTVAPKIEPVTVEARLEAIHTSGMTISGQSDVVDVVIGTDAALRDLKTGVVSRVNAAQYGTYTQLLRVHGFTVLKIIEDYVQRVAINKAQPDPVAVEYDIAEAESLSKETITRVQADLERFLTTGDPLAFMPNPNSMLCGKAWCPAHGTNFCTAHRGGKL